MHISSLSASVAIFALLLSAIFTVAQLPQTKAENPPPTRIYPAPTNLKVLPKTLTGEQVHAVMEQWTDELGAHCSTCHTADPKNIGPNSRPRLNYADDSKQEKATARLMYTMTEEINRSYLSKVDNSGAPVTCGTCHRGHLGPEPFSAAHDDRPRPSQTTPSLLALPAK